MRSLPAQQLLLSHTARYGPVHPDWYLGSYQHAVAEARRQSRPLFMYIHSDQYIESNIFCQYVIEALFGLCVMTLATYIAPTSPFHLRTALCNEGVVELLRQNFVCWGWDITVGQYVADSAPSSHSELPC